VKNTLLTLIIFGTFCYPVIANAQDTNKIGLKCTFVENRFFYEENSPPITVILDKKDKKLYTTAIRSNSKYLKYSNEKPTYYSARVDQQYGSLKNIKETEFINIDKVSLRLIHTYDTYFLDWDEFRKQSESFKMLIASNRYDKVYQCKVMEII
jgi:hypothetical protein